jgi:hypothetical protein
MFACFGFVYCFLLLPWYQIVSTVNQQTKKNKKKIDRSGYWGWLRSTPSGLGVAAINSNGQGERDPATPSGQFCPSGEPKKKKKDPASLKNRF